MLRAPFVFSAIVIFCASSFLAIADETSAISVGVQQSDAAAAVLRASANKQEREERVSRHYSGYDEAPAAMIASSHPV